MWNYKGMFLIENNKDGGLAIARYLKKKKTQRETTMLLSELPKGKRQTIPSVGEDWEPLPSSHTARWSINWYNHFKNSFAEQMHSYAQSKMGQNSHSNTIHNNWKQLKCPSTRKIHCGIGLY